MRLLEWEPKFGPAFLAIVITGAATGYGGYVILDQTAKSNREAIAKFEQLFERQQAINEGIINRVVKVEATTDSMLRSQDRIETKVDRILMPIQPK
jgi:hypothetical protein